MKRPSDILLVSSSDSTLVARGGNLSLQGRAKLMARKLFFISCLISLISCLPATGQVSATFRGDSSKIEIGDLFNMKLVVNTQQDIVVDFPKFPGDTIGRIAIVKKDKVDTAKFGSSTIYSQNITIQAYEDGRYIFEPMKIYFMDKATGQVDTAYTNAWELTVTTLPVDTTKPIKPIKAPLNVAYQLNEFYGWIAGGLILLLAIIVGVLLYLRYKKKPAAVIARPRPKDPAHIWAARELKKLDEEKLWQKDQVKLYHSRLTDVLRSYLEFRYDYYALESTTEEIQLEVEKLDIKMDAAGKLMETLRLADFVKFAKMSPAPDENMKSMQNALSFVDQTKQLVAEPQPEARKPKSNKQKRK